LIAAGFSESYIRLWSLKGEKLRGLRSDFQANQIKDRRWLFDYHPALLTISTVWLLS
jgi:hypothetical protein